MSTVDDHRSLPAPPQPPVDQSPVECRVCHEAYTISGAHVPRLLSCCGHTVCDACVHCLLAAQHQRNQPNVIDFVSEQFPMQPWPQLLARAPTMHIPAAVPTNNLGVVIQQVTQQSQPLPHQVDASMHMFNYYYDAGPQPMVHGITAAALTIDCPFDRVAESNAANPDAPPIYTLRKNYALIEVIERMGAVADTVLVQADDLISPLALTSIHSSSTSPVDQAPSSLLRSSTNPTASFDPLQHIVGGGGVAQSAAIGAIYAQQRALGVVCEENAAHLAVLFCCVCETHLCVECARRTHGSRTLQRHRSTTLSNKPHAPHKCAYHSAYAVEFVCQEPSCCQTSIGLMCLLCRDYGRHANHAHVLLETHAALQRSTLIEQRRDVETWQMDLATVQENVKRSIASIVGEGGVIPTFVTALPPHTSPPPPPSTVGSAHEANDIIHAYFTDLRSTLHTQYARALQTLDVHVHGRCQTLTDSYNEVALAMQQLRTLHTQLSTGIDLTDVSLVERSQVTRRLLDASRLLHETIMQSVPARLESMDIRTPVMLTRGDNRLHIGALVEVRVVMLGLDGAGKTTLLAKMRRTETTSTCPTIGFNVETLEYKNIKLTFWDVGGMPKLRPLWKHYYSNTQAIIFVVDAADRERYPEVQSELVKILSEFELRDAPLLILANKSDVIPDHPSTPTSPSSPSTVDRPESLTDALTLTKLCYGRAWHVHSCSARSGDGVEHALDWLAAQLLSSSPTPPGGGRPTRQSMVSSPVDQQDAASVTSSTTTIV